MSLEKAESYLKEAGFLDHVIELKESTAAVALAAEALGVEPGMIAKTMSFLQGEQPDLTQKSPYLPERQLTTVLILSTTQTS